MDLSCIISSGDLELYVLGHLPEEEAVKVRELARLFPEIQEELDRIAGTMEKLGNASSAVPSASVRDELMAKFRVMKREAETSAKIVPLTSDTKQATGAFTTSITPVRRSYGKLAAATVIGLMLCLGALYYFISENRETNRKVTSLENQIDTLNRNQQELVAYRETLRMMQSNDFMKVDLTNMPGKDSALAKVMWNTETHEVYLAGISMPAPPAGKQYQLWAIVDGKPVDAGIVNEISPLAAKMKTFERAEAFAISVENTGGSPTPTDVVMMGKI